MSITNCALPGGWRVTAVASAARIHGDCALVVDATRQYNIAVLVTYSCLRL